MQKTMICFSKATESNDLEAFNEQVKDIAMSFANQFDACSYAINDQDVAPADLLRMIFTTHPHDAVISLWSPHAHAMQDLFDACAELGEFQAYGVMESAAIPYDFDVGRVEGMCQIAFIKKPAAQPRAEWLHAWLGNHTKVAIDTQANFAYRQNVISVPLPLNSSEQPSWPLMDAIVEENFPAIAMTSREAFFNAEGDQDKFERHQQIMMASCFKFIDFEAFDCVPMSQYIVK